MANTEGGDRRDDGTTRREGDAWWLRALFDNALDAILIADNDGRYVDANPAACALLGYAHAELLRLSVWELTPASVREQAETLWREFGASGQQSGEFVLQRQDGALVEVEYRAMADFVPGLHLSILRDITERKRAEDALRRSEAQYRAVIETSQDGFWVVDREGRLLEANETYARLSGYSRAELCGMRVADLEANHGPAEIARQIAIVIRESGCLFQTRHRAKSGRIWQAEINCSYWPIAGGRIFVFIRDIRRRQRSELLLKARLHLSDIALKGNLNDLLQAALDVAEQFTGSEIGFFHFVDPDQEHLTLQAGSTNTLKLMCVAEGQGLHYPISEAGVWAECIHRRAPVIHNDYAAHPGKKGLPEGHAPVTRELTIPIFRNDRIAAIIGVGNKPEDYTEDDVEVLGELASILMDLVERKQAEQTLRYYEHIVAATPDSVALVDRNYVYLAVNAEYLRRTGQPREAIVGRSVSAVMGEEVFQTLLKDKLDRCLAGELVRYQDWFDFAGKGRRFLDVSYAPYRDETELVAGIAVSSRDITELKQVEECLRESEAKLQSIFRAAPIGLGLMVDRVFLEVNQATCQLLGYARAELIGKNARLVYSSQADFDFVGTEKYRQIKERGIGTVETRWRRKDGVILDVLVSSAAIDPGDLSRGIYFAAANITERKRTEARLAENAQRLQQLSRRLLSVQEEERRALARELHDDLGQQLVVLKLNLAMLERDLRGSAYQDRLIDCIHLAEQGRESIKQAIRRLRPALLDDLGLAEALHWYARSQTERTGCAIEVRDRLPSLLSPDLETAVFRIVQEAVNNAIQHGDARRIDIAIAVDAGELTLAVQDDGVGFYPDALSNNPASASGLGLIGMRERAELLDGRFALVSRPGSGARIDVTIPMPRTPP